MNRNPNRIRLAPLLHRANSRTIGSRVGIRVRVRVRVKVRVRVRGLELGSELGLGNLVLMFTCMCQD